MNGLSNGRLGTMLLVGTETVLFSSFIGAYIILRAAATAWPPVGTPDLSLSLSSFNTALLALSALFIWKGYARVTLLLGAVFLLLQGKEFSFLYAKGLTLQTGVYGALFYTLIACHGLHVLSGLIVLSLGLDKPEWVSNMRIYWYFVTGVWGVLFAALYLI